MSVRDLAEGLVDAGNRVTVIAQSRQQHDEYRTKNGVAIRHLSIANRFSRDRVSDANIVSRALRQLYPEFNPHVYTLLRKELSQLKPDVVHTHILAGVSTRIWRVAHELDLPVVHSLRDYYLTCLRGTRVRDKHRCRNSCPDCQLLSLRRKRDTQFVDAVIGISNFILELHTDLGYFTDTPDHLLIPNGIAAHKIHQGIGAEAKSPHALQVGFLGRLHPSKGIELFIDSLRKLQNDNVRGYIAGVGNTDYEDHIRSMITESCVEYLGHVDPEEFLNKLDVLVVPSLFEEPFGRVILEANAQAVPVICSRRGGAQNLVVPNKTGWLFEPNKPEQLETILHRLSSDGIEDTIRDACLAQARKFDIQNTIEAHQRLYMRLSGRTGTPEFKPVARVFTND